jgi:hypothetical protein
MKDRGPKCPGNEGAICEEKWSKANEEAKVFEKFRARNLKVRVLLQNILSIV